MLTCTRHWRGIHRNGCTLAGPCTPLLGDCISRSFGIAKGYIETEILGDVHGQGGHIENPATVESQLNGGSVN